MKCYRFMRLFLRSEMEVSMAQFIFASKEHENFFYFMLKKCGNHDSYHRAFFYCVGISDTTRANVGRLFDFEQHHIKPEGLHEGWQTGGSVRLTRLAFNLWNVMWSQGMNGCQRLMKCLTVGISYVNVCFQK